MASGGATSGGVASGGVTGGGVASGDVTGGGVGGQWGRDRWRQALPCCCRCQRRIRWRSLATQQRRTATKTWPTPLGRPGTPIFRAPAELALLVL